MIRGSSRRMFRHSSPMPGGAGGDTKDDPGPDDISDGFLGQCATDWMQTRDAWNANAKVWNRELDCYDYVLTRICFCTQEYRGPFAIQVRGGAVVSSTYVGPPSVSGSRPAGPATGSIPTMNDLLDQIRDECFAECPRRGAAMCNTAYGPFGQVTSMYIDRNRMIADEEIGVEITDFEPC